MSNFRDMQISPDNSVSQDSRGNARKSPDLTVHVQSAAVQQRDANDIQQINESQVLAVGASPRWIQANAHASNASTPSATNKHLKNSKLHAHDQTAKYKKFGGKPMPINKSVNYENKPLDNVLGQK